MKTSFYITVRDEAFQARLFLARIRKTARAILKVLGWKKAELHVLLVGDRRIRVLNKRYLRHDHSTDVIAFGRTAGRLRPWKPARGRPVLGDIVISLDTTRRQAVQYGNSFQYELAFYLCHGILHLMGWRDDTRRRRLRMWRKQERVLNKIGIIKIETGTV